MISLSKTNKVQWSPFFVQNVSESLSVLRVKVRARAIKTREIYLLEWALMAPLYELDPKPNLDDIKHELGISKIDFLVKTAGELQTLGVLERENENQYRLSESGEKLYQQKKMISDPREIYFPIFREATSSEWFIGVDKVLDLEVSEIIDENLSIPSYIPEEIIQKHVNQLKNVLKPKEKILDHEVDDVDQVQVSVKANLFLTKEGLTIRVSEHPFGNKHNKLLNKILYDQFIREGLIKEHLTKIRENSPYRGSSSTQFHQIKSEAKLFLPDDIDKIFNNFLLSNESWLITNIDNSSEIIQNHVKKPQIIVYVIDDDTIFEENRNDHDQDYTFLPSSVIIHIEANDVQIPSNTIISNEKYAFFTNVEVNGYEIPVFILKKDIKSKNKRLVVLNKILNKLEEGSLERNLANYYLEPSIDKFRSLVQTIPIQKVTDRQKSEKAFTEILEAQTHLKTEIFNLELNTKLLNKMVSFYSWEELVKIDFQRLVLNFKSYLARLDHLLDKKLDFKLDSTWIMFRQSITEVLNTYTDINQIITNSHQKLPSDFAEKISKDLYSLINKCLNYIETILKNIPKPPNVNEYEELFNELEIFKSKVITATYINHLKDLVKTETFNIEPLEMLSVQAFLSKNSLPPTDRELTLYLSKALTSINIDLVDKNGIKLLTQINSLVSSINSGYPIHNSVLKILPKEISNITDQASIRNVINNLKGLHAIIGKQAEKYISRIIKNIEKSLQPRTFSELGLWLLFLERVKSVLERPLGTTIIKTNAKQIWGRTLPYLEEDIDREKIVRNSLGQLKLGSQLKKWRKEKRKEKTDDEKDDTNMYTFPNPPIERIVVDGNNVVKTEKTREKYSVNKLIQLYNELQKKYKFEKVIIFISAALKYDVHDFDDLKPLIKKKVVRETPAGVSDDYFVIQFAIKDNALILTNDLFRDWKEKYPELKNEIQKRSVTFMIDPNTQEYILGEYSYTEDE